MARDPDGTANRNERRANVNGVHRTSAIRVLGLPLYCIAQGPDPETGKGFSHARGIIAVGNLATGVIAVGGMARGIIAIGGVAMGVVAVGGIAVGALLGIGGVAAGYYAIGGVAFGVNPIGGTKIRLGP